MLRTEMEVLFLAFKLVQIIREEEERLKREFRGAEIHMDTESFPFTITVVYDFLRLDKEKRYRLFDFEKRLLDRMEEVLKAELPLTVQFIRKK